MRHVFFATTMIVLVLSLDAVAIPITVTDPFQTLVDTTSSCFYRANQFESCTSTAFVNTTSLSASSTEFRKSFDAWNSGNSHPWTLLDGGALPGGEFEVSLFGAAADSTYGGVDIRIDWTYSGDTGIENPPLSPLTGC